MTQFNDLDTVANLKPIPHNRLSLVEPDYQSIKYLPIGQVGTVLEIYEGENPQYLIEFADLQGREYATAVLMQDEMLVLHYELSLTS